jgi:hypothetical protein
MMMKVLRSFVLALAIGVASVTTAQARDSFSIGISVGGHGYHAYPEVSYYPVDSYYVAPQVVYYNAPIMYRHHAPYAYYHTPVHPHSYYNGSRHHYRGHGQHGGYGHGRHGRHH